MVSDRFSRFRSVRTRMTAGVGGVAAVVASWGIGLFEAKSEPPPPALAAGRTIAAGEWQVRLDRVETGNLLPDGRLNYGRGAIMLRAQVTNRTSRSSNSYTQAVKLVTPIAGVDRMPIAYLMRDRSHALDLHPGMPEELVFVWNHPTGTRVPDTLRFAIEARDFKPRDNLYAAAGWFNPHTIGTIDLPVTRGPTFGSRPAFGASPYGARSR